MLAALKKFPESEYVQIGGVETLSLLCDVSEEFVQSIMKAGALRFSVSKLEEDNVLKSVGLVSLKFLHKVATRSREAVNVMNHQNAMQAVMAFLMG